jgi:signal recognition particle subunit SRP14
MSTKQIYTVSYNAEPSTFPSSPVDTPFPDQVPTKPLPILIRATDGKSKEKRKEGKKTKLSTVVDAGDLEAFYTRYAELCKLGMTGLKKRDRSKRKEKAKAKKKKGGAATLPA